MTRIIRAIIAMAAICSPIWNVDARTALDVEKEDTGLFDYFHPGRVYYLEPQQVHLSYWGDPTQMWVTWVTFDNVTLDNKVRVIFVNMSTRLCVESGNGWH